MQEGPEASQLCPPAQQGDLELSVLGGGEVERRLLPGM